MTWNATCVYARTTSRTDYIFGHRLLIFLILATFWLCELWAFFKQRRNDIKFGILTCPDYLQNRLELGHGFFIFWRHLDLVKQVKFGVSGIFFRMHGRNCLKNWNDAISWPPLELIISGSWSVDFLNFGAIFTWQNRSNMQLWYPQHLKR